MPLYNKLSTYTHKAGCCVEITLIEIRLIDKIEVLQLRRLLRHFLSANHHLCHLGLFFTCSASFPSNPLIITPLFLSFFFVRPSPFPFANSNFLLSSSVSLSLSDLLVSSSCDITGHCSPLGLDTRPRCQATAVKGLSESVCVWRARVCVCLCLFIAT